MGTIIVKQKAAGLIKKGSPLISQMDLAQELRADEGEVVKVYDQQRHFLGIIGLVSYYWFLWALFQESNGKPVGEFLYKWYRYTKQYCTEALRLYEEEK